jgi:hypothetical protein
VERRRRCAASAELLQALAHLTRGPVGVGDGEHLARWRNAQVMLVGDPVGQRPRLAGSRSGEDAQRPERRDDGSTLLRVECGENLFSAELIPSALNGLYLDR